MSRAGSVVGALAVVGLAVVAYASLIERNAFTVRRENLDILEPGANPIRVLHLSDAHLAPWQRTRSEWIRGLADLSPDLVVVTGDMTGHVNAIPFVAETLAAFEGVPGVVVHGSNDYFAPRMPNPFAYLWAPSSPAEHGEPIDTAALDAVYANLGWTVIDNGATRLTINGSTLAIVGTDDPHLRRDRLDDAAAALDVALDEISAPLGAVLGVTHAPYRRVLDGLTAMGASVIFAGHTHGGQVCVPGVGALTTNSDLPRRLARGLAVWNHRDRSAFLNVSAGIGTSIFAPVRFACPPEAVLVTLRAGDFGYA